MKEQGKIYTIPFTTLLAGATVDEPISIAGNKDFILKQIKVFTPDYTKEVFIKLQDTSTSELWQNAQWHFSLFGDIEQAGLIKFSRFISRNTEITITMVSTDAANVDLQVIFIGIEPKTRAVETEA